MINVIPKNGHSYCFKLYKKVNEFNYPAASVQIVELHSSMFFISLYKSF